MSTIAIIQARMGSERLPGKVLLPLCGKPMLLHSIVRLKRCRSLDRIVIATGDRKENQPILELARAEGVEGFAGSENDVLDRYCQAADRYKPQHVVRCTGDCPMLDPNIIERIIKTHVDGGFDYTSNTLERSYPRGYDTEVMTFASLKKAASEARVPYEREHVTPYIWEHPSWFKLGQVRAKSDQMQPTLRVTVDTPEDFRFIQEIFEALYAQDHFFGIDSVMALVRRRPELIVNSHVQQKTFKADA
ncbi:MAG TPA: glycosyltransferase family protein [Candidatus Omnitrophota bacterium]|nr:glycosyltransferase family protein [Candidatus Omnitrophota bacterium]